MCASSSCSMRLFWAQAPCDKGNVSRGLCVRMPPPPQGCAPSPHWPPSGASAPPTGAPCACAPHPAAAARGAAHVGVRRVARPRPAAHATCRSVSGHAQRSVPNNAHAASGVCCRDPRGRTRPPHRAPSAAGARVFWAPRAQVSGLCAPHMRPSPGRRGRFRTSSCSATTWAAASPPAASMFTQQATPQRAAPLAWQRAVPCAMGCSPARGGVWAARQDEQPLQV
jgi:hypothetical protein